MHIPFYLASLAIVSATPFSDTSTATPELTPAQHVVRRKPGSDSLHLQARNASGMAATPKMKRMERCDKYKEDSGSDSYHKKPEDGYGKVYRREAGESKSKRMERCDKYKEDSGSDSYHKKPEYGYTPGKVYRREEGSKTMQCNYYDKPGGYTDYDYGYGGHYGRDVAKEVERGYGHECVGAGCKQCGHGGSY
jgi:hypothetical protein